MKIHNIILFLFFTFSSSIELAAQQNTNDIIHQMGKMYGVVFVVVILLVGLIYLLWRIEKKLDRVEKLTDHEHKTS